MVTFISPGRPLSSLFILHKNNPITLDPPPFVVAGATSVKDYMNM